MGIQNGGEEQDHRDASNDTDRRFGGFGVRPIRLGGTLKPSPPRRPVVSAFIRPFRIILLETPSRMPVRRLSAPATQDDIPVPNAPTTRQRPMPGLPSRDSALALMQEYTASESLRKHMLAVEAAMQAYAIKFGEDPDRWGLAGLIHDFDYERFPNAAHSATEEHPARGVAVLRDLGWPEDILQAILGHATYCNVPRESRMAKALFAVDELTGLITATALVKPTRSVHDVEARSVRKKMKDKAFARGVSREDVLLGAQELGVELDDHIDFVIGAMRGIAPQLGLAGTPGEP
jgi:predicted hydrolase (HD superfamily)